MSYQNECNIQSETKNVSNELIALHFIALNEKCETSSDSSKTIKTPPRKENNHKNESSPQNSSKRAVSKKKKIEKESTMEKLRRNYELVFTVRDSIHGDMSFSPLCTTVIRTPEFGRLHNLRQMGMAYKVEPSASHTRAAHSLGVCHVTSRVLRHLITVQPELKTILDERTIDLILIGALVHDIGHGPFCHTFDCYFFPYLDSAEDREMKWCDHERRSQDIFRRMNKKHSLGLSEEEVDFVCSVISPDRSLARWHENIVNNKMCGGFDTDKLDYLLRDSASTNRVTMSLNLERLINSMRIVEGRMAFAREAVDDVTQVYMLRYTMQKCVYSCPEVIAYDYMARDMFQSESIKSDLLKCLRDRDVEEFCKWDDARVLSNAPDVLRDRFHSSDVYSIISKNNAFGISLDELECETRRIGFMSGPDDPLLEIPYYISDKTYINEEKDMKGGEHHTVSNITVTNKYMLCSSRARGDRKRPKSSNMLLRNNYKFNEICVTYLYLFPPKSDYLKINNIFNTILDRDMDLDRDPNLDRNKETDS